MSVEVSDPDKCEHGGLRVLCILCRPKKQTASFTKPATTRRGFPANFPGECPACGGEIDTGDDITSSDDGWIHVSCWDES